jgi:hypothetical protein
MNNTPENDKSEYVHTGMRDADPRAGFGDDGGTRVGRPDGAGSDASPEGHARTAAARVAPHDVEGPPVPGQAGTNTGPVAGGIEGSELDGHENAGSGQQQARVRAAAEGLNDQHAAGDNRRVDNL